MEKSGSNSINTYWNKPNGLDCRVMDLGRPYGYGNIDELNLPAEVMAHIDALYDECAIELHFLDMDWDGVREDAPERATYCKKEVFVSGQEVPFIFDSFIYGGKYNGKEVGRDTMLRVRVKFPAWFDTFWRNQK